MSALGKHVLIELWGCNSDINDADSVRNAILQAVDAVGATMLHIHVHSYSPYGVTGLAVLAESHMSIHSWPEHGYLAADVFTCGTRTDPVKAVDVLKDAFEPEHISYEVVKRGVRPIGYKHDDRSTGSKVLQDGELEISSPANALS